MEVVAAIFTLGTLVVFKVQSFETLGSSKIYSTTDLVLRLITSKH